MASNARSKVFVVGMGAVSAAGTGAEALWQAARSGNSAIKELKLARDVKNRVKIAAQVRDFAPEKYISKTVANYCDPFSQYAIAAADEAIEQARLKNSFPFGGSTAVVLGAGIGGVNTIESVHHNFLVDQGRIDPFAIPKAMPSSATSHLTIRYGCTGPSFAISSACASATQAIGVGARLIQGGVVDRAIVGGADATIEPVTFRSWEALRVLTPDFCRPFSKNRNGMVLGEGAAIFVLESYDCMRARGVDPKAEILGYGTSTDAIDMLRPDVTGAATAMTNALTDSSLSPADVDYINAHGTGTILNDIVEARAIHAVFGNRATEIPTSSTKPIHGHALGAAGALEFLVAIRALEEGIVPPTINWLEKDNDCNIDAVPNEARACKLRVVMSNSFAFGGINAVLIAGTPD